MTIDKLMVLVAVAASLVLVTQASARLFPVIALVASGLEALLMFRVITFSISFLLLCWAPWVRIPTQADGTTTHVWAHGVLREDAVLGGARLRGGAEEGIDLLVDLVEVRNR